MIWLNLNDFFLKILNFIYIFVIFFDFLLNSIKIPIKSETFRKIVKHYLIKFKLFRNFKIFLYFFSIFLGN